ncbi:MAG: hypothetical protein WCD23_11340, partial [Candidatus Acidiferrales bacterium]
ADTDFHGVTDAGIWMRPLQAVQLESGKVKLTGSFGVFFAGDLIAHFYDERGSSLGTTRVAAVTPAELVDLQTEVAPNGKAARVALHLVDQSGVDRGALQEVPIGVQDSR